jgi:hypothetical protein
MQENAAKDSAACPFMKKPFEDCYCAKSDSTYIEKVLNFCGGNYGQCEIYRRTTGEQEKLNQERRKEVLGDLDGWKLPITGH